MYSAIVTSTLIIQQLVEMTTGNPAILVHRALELAVDLGLPPAEFKRIEPAADHYASGLLEEALDGVDPDDAPVIGRLRSSHRRRPAEPSFRVFARSRSRR